MSLRSSAPPAPCCLLVEDQALIALSLEAYLEEAGFAVTGPFPSNAAALAWLQNATPQIAVLDVMLGDGPADALAKVLKERGVPFLVYSGHAPGPDVQPEFDGAPWLEKPARREDLLRALRGLRERRAA